MRWMAAPLFQPDRGLRGGEAFGVQLDIESSEIATSPPMARAVMSRSFTGHEVVDSVSHLRTQISSSSIQSRSRTLRVFPSFTILRSVPASKSSNTLGWMHEARQTDLVLTSLAATASMTALIWRALSRFEGAASISCKRERRHTGRSPGSELPRGEVATSCIPDIVVDVGQRWQHQRAGPGRRRQDLLLFRHRRSGIRPLRQPVAEVPRLRLYRWRRRLHRRQSLSRCPPVCQLRRHIR
jgi:hypothetical protein